VKCGDDIKDRISKEYFICSWCDNIISILIAGCQTLFILGTHDDIKFEEKTMHRNSPRIFFFLGIFNFGLWASDSIGETRVPVLSLIPYRYFDIEFWDVMTRIILPLTIFFRFHTGLDFSRMWWERRDMRDTTNDPGFHTTHEIGECNPQAMRQDSIQANPGQG
jgi:hypothetical protein